MIKCNYQDSAEEAALIEQYTAQGYRIAENRKLQSGNTIIFRDPSANVQLMNILKTLVTKGIITIEEIPALMAAKLEKVK